MPGYIEDRWLTKKKDPATGQRRRTARYGKGKRYRVGGVPGVADCSFAALQDAKDWLAEAQTDTKRGGFYDVRDGEITLQEFVEKHWWPSYTCAASTRATVGSRVRKHILAHLGSLPLVSIGVEELRAWRAKLLQTQAASSVRSIWAILRTIFEAAVEANRLPANPLRSTKSLRPPKPPQKKLRAWTREKVVAVYGAMKDRYRVLFTLGFGAGLRQAEAFGFSPDDIDWEAGEIHVRRQLRQGADGKMYFCLPKGEKERTIPVPPSWLRRVRAHMEAFPPVTVTLPWRGSGEADDEGAGEGHAEAEGAAADGGGRGEPEMVTVTLLTTTVTGKPIRFDAFNKYVWREALGAAGYLKIRQNRPRATSRWESDRANGFHALRHTFVTRLLRDGVSIMAVSEWLGHSDPGFTLRKYGHAMPKDDERGRAVMEAWLTYPTAHSPQILPSDLNDLAGSVAAALGRVRPVEFWKAELHGSQVDLGLTEDAVTLAS